MSADRQTKQRRRKLTNQVEFRLAALLGNLQGFSCRGHERLHSERGQIKRRERSSIRLNAVLCIVCISHLPIYRRKSPSNSDQRRSQILPPCNIPKPFSNRQALQSLLLKLVKSLLLPSCLTLNRLSRQSLPIPLRNEFGTEL